MDSLQQGIGLLGGTFNPVHNGHVCIARSFLDSGHLKSLYILLNPAPPHKQQQDMAPYALRRRMLKAAFSALEQSVISDVETRLPPPAYTLQTLRHLKAQWPDEIFYLCLGADSLAHFKTWRRWQRILTMCRLMVAERPGFSNSAFDRDILQKTTFVEHRPIEVSSSLVRKKIARGEPINKLVPRQVQNIIQKEGLYRERPRN